MSHATLRTLVTLNGQTKAALKHMYYFQTDV